MIRNNQKPQIVTRWECFIKKGPLMARQQQLAPQKVQGEEY